MKKIKLYDYQQKMLEDIINVHAFKLRGSKGSKGSKGSGGGFAEIEGSGRSCSGIRYLTYDVFAAQDDEMGRCPKAGE